MQRAESLRVADAYAPPRTVAESADPRESSHRTLTLRAFLLLGVAVSVFVLALTAAAAAEEGTILLYGGGGVAVLGVAGAITALVALARGLRREPPATTLASAGSLLALVLNLGAAAVGALTALLSTLTFTRGRQIRRFGRPALPPVIDGEAWALPASSEEVALARISPATLLAEDGLDAETRAGLAAQWRENGRTERASVAAVARLAAELVALGAPPALVAAAHADALDEIRHAELCFGLARAIDGRAASPGPFRAAIASGRSVRVRALSLGGLAVDSLIDGALHEGASARIVAKLARRAADPTVRAVLKQIAADEGRHAAHGWDVVAWCLREGGAPVADALAAAVAVLPRAMRSELPAAAREGGWERWGIMGAALERQELDKARAYVESRVRAMIATRAWSAA